jgi:Arc/MetJ family transcription regulator
MARDVDQLNLHSKGASRMSKRARAVRTMVSETSWLDGQLRWQDGRIVWEGIRGPIIPGPAELALAQRRLRQIQRYPIAAKLVLGDYEAWLERRRERLVLAKRLISLPVLELCALVHRARADATEVIPLALRLLHAEAEFTSDLPICPVSILLACGRLAEPDLTTLIQDESASSAARALAALTLGALRKASPGYIIPPGQANIRFSSRWFRRAYDWGSRFGIPATPALVVALLADQDGARLVWRYLNAIRPDNPFLLSGDVLYDLALGGMPLDQLVILVEAIAAAEPLASRVLQCRHELQNHPALRRHMVAATIRFQRRELLVEIIGLLHDYIRATADPCVVALFVQVVDTQLDLPLPSSDIRDTITRVLGYGLSLPDPSQRMWLELLLEQHSKIWDRSSFPRSKKAKRRLEWIEEHYICYVHPMWTLLHVTGDIVLVREAIALDVMRVLAAYNWQDPDRYRLVLTILREIRAEQAAFMASLLCECITLIPDARTARALFHPLLHALAPLPHTMRNHLMEQILLVLPNTRHDMMVALPQLIRFVPHLLGATLSGPDHDCVCRTLLTCMLAIHTADPQGARDWMNWLVAHLTERWRTVERSWDEMESARLGVSLAARLAGDDFAQFRRVLSAALQHTFEERTSQLEDGIALLHRFPALRRTLAENFPTRPRRCSALIARLGLAAHLGPDTAVSLSELETDLRTPELSVKGFLIVDPKGSQGEWNDVLFLEPELAPVAADYLRAQWLLGESFDLPSGVRQALEQPRKLKRELEYLERRLQVEPEQQNLVSRAASLRARLAEKDSLLRSIREEVSERLVQITAETQLAAAERQVMATFAVRVARVAGPLPSDLHLDDNLINATLLAAGLSQNRRLLHRLLRAYVSGDASWREHQAANARFLADLAARGIDPTVWLASHSRRFRCSEVAGGWVKLSLETDALRILQMGNYFGTCLSTGDINAFSTVANACELNKRVIYATDDAGHIVGRKLIGINREGRLIGFHTYTNTSGKRGNAALDAIFHQYVDGFAELCGIELSNMGTVPTLFAEDWYDDGAVPWDAVLKWQGKAVSGV